jgi:ribonuclease HI
MDDTSLSRSSRIDRIYTSLTDAELSILTAISEVSHAGSPTAAHAAKLNSLLEDDPSRGLKADFRRLHVSDHLPVTVRFFTLSPTTRRSFNAPTWLGEKKSIAEATRAAWTGYTSGDGTSPFTALADWKAAVKAAVQSHFATAKAAKQAKSSSIESLTAAVALLRACSRTKQDRDHIKKMLHTHTPLRPFVDTTTHRYQLTGLVAHIDGLLAAAPAEAAQAINGHEASDTIEVDLPPSFIPGAGREGTDPITALKERLPSMRARLTALRSKPGDELTSKPAAMGDIIVQHYEEVWAKNEAGAQGPAIRTYIQQVAGKMQIPTELQPVMPSAEDFIDIISKTNDSCAGPDGTPFSYYRTYVRLDPSLAHVLADVCALIGAGVTPPKGYNHARFFLIPKKAGGLIGDTRGISVSNGDNRLVATGIVRAITPALQACIHKDQKGFVPGRVGTEHAHAITTSFYSSLSRKQQRYVLLLDTRRAFDTVSHAFIHACLAAMGFAGWLCRAVAGLLHDVVVIPVLAEMTKHRIRIERGVKQGCPLSPLLFVICFDILLHQLDCISGMNKYAYADDLALELRSVKSLIKALHVVKLFGAFSDLHTNQTKTVIVAAQEPSACTRSRLVEAGWDQIEFRDSAVYLGLLFGPEVSTEDVFAAAYDKYNKRLALFHRVMESLSLHDRIVLVNVFLFPLFFYLAQFYVIPYTPIVKRAQESARRAIVAFGGFGYAHLVTPHRSTFGPHTPLRDLWAVNMVLLGWGFDMETSNKAPEVAMGDFSRVMKYNFLDRSMRPDEHAAYGAFIFLYDHAPRTHQLIDLAGLPPLTKPPSRRRWIYRQLAESGYWMPRHQLTHPTSLQVKVGKFIGCPPDIVLARHVMAHARIASGLVTPARWNTQFRLVMNVLPFEKRRLDAKMDHTVRRSHISCYLCGSGTDSAAHVYTCPVVVAARAMVSDRAGCKLRDGLRYTALAFPPTSTPLATLLTMCFNWSVWRLRLDYFSTLARPRSTRHTSLRIANHTLQHFIPSDKGPSMQERKLVALANQPPPGIALCFTDGSRLDDGHAGAGYTVLVPGFDEEAHSDYLGRCDNNEAEMEAIARATRRLLVRHQEGWRGRAILFSDSAGCLGYLLRGWTTKVRTVMAREARRLYHIASKRFTFRLYWIRGHCGVEGNEKADVLAGEGALQGRTQNPTAHTCTSRTTPIPTHNTPHPASGTGRSTGTTPHLRTHPEARSPTAHTHPPLHTPPSSDGDEPDWLTGWLRGEDPPTAPTHRTNTPHGVPHMHPTNLTPHHEDELIDFCSR